MSVIDTINTTVKECSSCTTEEIPEQVLNATEPLVLRGLVEDWPLTQAGKQSSAAAADYLRQFYQDVPVVVSIGPPDINGRVFYNEQFTDFNYQSRKVNLHELLNKILAHADDATPPTFYMGSTVVDKWLPDFRNTNDLPLNAYNPRVGIWIGNKTRIAAHWDFPSNIACTVVGHRRVTLFPPEQLENLYPGPLDWAPGGQAISLVDFYKPDYQKFPGFKEAIRHAQVAELGPGDALLIPSMWWHHVESLSSFNVLVNYWWKQTPAYMGTPMNVLHHALLSLRNLPFEQRQAWHNMLTHYIFNADEHTNAHIPEHARGFLGDMDEDLSRKLRAFLLNQLKR